MEKQQQQFILDLAEVLNITEEADLKKVISDLGEKNIKALFEGYSQFDDESHRKAFLKKQLTPEPTFAKLGAKLNYIKYLRGECPEGYVSKFAAGGCMKCIKKAEKGEVVNPNVAGEVISPKDSVNRFGADSLKMIRTIKSRETKPKYEEEYMLNPHEMEYLRLPVKDGLPYVDEKTYWDYFDRNNPKLRENIEKVREAIRKSINIKYG
jgi:hypothetical protein